MPRRIKSDEKTEEWIVYLPGIMISCFLGDGVHPEAVSIKLPNYEKISTSISVESNNDTSFFISKQSDQYTLALMKDVVLSERSRRVGR